MTKLLHLAHAVLAATLLLGAGCASDLEEPTTSTDPDVQLAEPAELDALAQDPEQSRSLVGCSNAQIRVMQDACRNTYCGTRGSYGIHWCDQVPSQGLYYAQCDCRTGEDPTLVAAI